MNKRRAHKTEWQNTFYNFDFLRFIAKRNKKQKNKY